LFGALHCVARGPSAERNGFPLCFPAFIPHPG